MAKASFIQLCNELRPYLLNQTTQMRMPLTVEVQFGVTLYYLSDEAHYRKIANAFGKIANAKVEGSAARPPASQFRRP